MKLKLIKGRSYNAANVRATADKPIFETADTKLAKRLTDSGYFIVVAEPANNNSGGNKQANNNSSGSKEVPLEKMKGKQLDDYAKEKGIDLTGLTKDADKLAKIQDVINSKKLNLEKATDNSSADEDGNDGDADFDDEV